MDHSADFCPTCGQPRERRVATIGTCGLSLSPNRFLSFGDSRIYLAPAEAEFMRIVMERGRASSEFLLLRISPDADDTIIRTYAWRIRQKLAELTNGAVALRSIWGWGYELAPQAVAVAA
jgi:DNA-binding response OmpR family regulator